MATRETYGVLAALINEKLEGRKFKVEIKDNLATEVIKAVKQVGGQPGAVQDIEGYTTSKYQTIRDFIEVLGNSSFKVTNKDLQRLLRQFETENAVVEIQLFCEQIKNKKSLLVQIGKWLHSPISNSPTWIATKQRLSEIRDKAKDSVEKVREKIMDLSLGTQFKTIFKLLSGVGATMGAVAMLLKDFDVMVGPIPLGCFGIDSPTSVQDIEVSHSNKIVKFRAVGSIFLAHQIGGKDSIKIQGMLTGDLKFLFLSLIWLLTMISKGHSKLLEWGDDIKSLGTGTFELFRNIAGTPTALEKIDKTVVESPSYIRHVTFPVILTHEIITNCYIETFSFQETLDGKKDVIKYDLLLRTYDEPHEWVGNDANTLFAAKNKTKTAVVLKYLLNYFWRTLKQANEVDTSSWKIKGYYDIDPLDMAMTFTMGFVGFL